MNKSIWISDKLNLKLSRKNIETDILIIGGGISGASCMLNLIDSGYDITLIDSDRIGGVVTRNTTGKLNIMQGYNYSKIESVTNLSTALKYLEAQKFSLKLIKKYKIKCDLVKNDSYLFTNEQKNIKKIIHEKGILEAGGIKCTTVNKLPNNYPCLFGIKISDSYVFNPIKYINGIVDICRDKANILELTRALSICKKLDYFLIKTNRNKIKAKKVIICTHYPILSNKLEFPFKLKIDKEYVVSAKTSDSYRANMLCDDGSVTSIRYYGDYIIYGGNNSSLASNCNHFDNMNNLITDFRRHFGNKISHTWYNYDLISNDYLPIIGRLDNNNVFVCTAFNKWGMTNGILSGKIISDIILDKKNEFIDLFDPNRSTNIKKIINGCGCCFNSIKGYVSGFKKQKNIKYKTYNGKEYAIYVDEKKKEHVVINKCPHMGCKLIFNFLDKTWDCPCHGSRFNVDGKVIKGPSNYSIAPKK
ncbi:MAG: FAD-dependent oxidoreductase [Bacilli bacterium]|nr:FAD-dependent oxidoreductase [Bacilli bacterium]